MDTQTLSLLFSDSPSDHEVAAAAAWAYLFPRASLDPPHNGAEEIEHFRIWRLRQRIWIWNSDTGEYRIVRLNENRRPVRLYCVERTEKALSLFYKEITFRVTKTVWGEPPKKTPRLAVHRLTGYGATATIVATLAALIITFFVYFR